MNTACQYLNSLVMIVKTLLINSGKTGGPSMTTKPPSGPSTVKPTSGSGNLHAESTI